MSVSIANILMSKDLVSALTSSAVDRGLDSWSGKTKDNKIGICCFSATHTTLRRTNKDRLARNHNNMFEWSDMPTRRLLIQ